MKQVTWPSREDVISTTGIVIATVFFFGVFLAAVDWLVQRGVTYVFKVVRRLSFRAVFRLRGSEIDGNAVVHHPYLLRL
jgi:preprotein translocase SecE subunit